MIFKRILLYYTIIILFFFLSDVCCAESDLKSYYIKGVLRQVIALIKGEYIDPVREEDLLNGALAEMQNVDGTISWNSCRDWAVFETVFDKACRQNPSISPRLGEAAIRGMVKGLKDPYSLFMNPDEWDYYKRVTSGGTFAGIGVELAVRGSSLIIATPLCGSPAEKAGILPGDEVLKIDGKPVNGTDIYKVINSFDGPAGSPIALTLKRGKMSIDIKVTRQNISFRPVAAKIIGKSPATGYIKVPYFGPSTDKEVKKALDILKNKAIRRLILDLRNNPGGDFNTCLKTAEFFVSDKPLVKVYRKGGNLEDIYPESSYDYIFHTVVLINEGSASAAEVLSCALSGNKKAVLIGTTSFGKAVVQSIYSLPGNAALKLTTSKYFTPAGFDINHTGLKPDIVVKTIYPAPELTDDPCILKALEYLKKI